MKETELKQELERARTRSDNQAEADALVRLADLYKSEGRREDSLEAYQQAYAIYKDQGDDRRRLDLICRVCGVLIDLDRPQEAEQGLAAGLDLARRINEVGPRARLLDIRARLHLDREQPAKAAADISEAIDICRTYRDRKGELRMTELLTKTLFNAGRLADAAVQAERAADLAQVVRRPDRRAAMLVEAAYIKKNMGLMDQALEALDRAEKICLEHGQEGWAADLAGTRQKWSAEAGKKR